MKNHFAARERFLQSSPRGLVQFDEKRLESFLPLARPDGGNEAGQRITYRVYLEAIRQFIHDHWEQFLEVVAGQGLKDAGNIQYIDIIAEKHGGDYHPARIRVQSGDVYHCFVVNVALTSRGKQRVSQDFHLLDSLRERFHANFTPEVYFLGEVNVQAQNQEELVIVMFMGEWLDGYHEFHLSVEPESGKTGTILWDLNRGYQFLSVQTAAEIFRQAAIILTYYYDTGTFAEVYPWHHAAGDFVVKCSEGDVDVKLITLRQYASRMVFPDYSFRNRLKALMIFLANLTVRMRLDRLDGVGVIVWAGAHAVEGAISGFLAGMKAQVACGMCEDMLLQHFLLETKKMSPAEVAEIFQMVIESYNEESPDSPVILDHLADHIFQVYRLFQELPSSL
ncbi:MAG: hypothetical protein ACLP5H_18565 [Desulfomonilaceae bacterium]